MKRLVVVALLACGSPSTPVEPTGRATGNGSGSGVQPTSATCDAVRPKVEELYRAAARGGDPARVNEVVSDNTTMVMNDCAKAPDKAAACITAATTVHELEARCLEPIDEEGTEGDRVAR